MCFKNIHAKSEYNLEFHQAIHKIRFYFYYSTHNHCTGYRTLYIYYIQFTFTKKCLRMKTNKELVYFCLFLLKGKKKEKGQKHCCTKGMNFVNDILLYQNMYNRSISFKVLF